MTRDASPTTVLRLRPDRTQRLEALLAGAGPHLEAVLDVGTAANDDLLVVLAAPAEHLAALLETSEGLPAGEAVTVLVPLAQALARLHRAGVAHGGIRPGAVVLDQEGSPSWAAPLAPALRRAVGAQTFAERVADDVTAFRDLVVALLGPEAPTSDDLDAMAIALFDVAAPEPVRLGRRDAPVLSTMPARLLPAAGPTEVAAPPGREGLGVVLRGALGTVRPRMWIGLGAVAALLVAALVLLPSADGTTALPAASATVRSGTATSSPSSTPVAGRDIAADRAVAALLAERERCLTAGSATCLRRVDAAGSPALDADLRAVESGAEPVRVDAERLEVTAAGTTALATAARATVLAVRDRNEWRLRDVVAEPPSSG